MDIKDFESIMDMAIAAEVEAFEFYNNVATTVADKGMKKIFQDLAKEEAGHKASLQNIKEKELQNFSFTAASDYKVAESMALPKLSMDMKPADAIALAMKKEEEAMKMYTGLALAATEPEKVKLFINLANMESGHKAKMEGFYTQMAFPEVW
ncbi:MAG: ferritin family protein [Syntrophomonadaceae bacterium]|nr:ferritin family protein [Syntrophomonadaceae bacterium]